MINSESSCSSSESQETIKCRSFDFADLSFHELVNKALYQGLAHDPSASAGISELFDFHNPGLN